MPAPSERPAALLGLALLALIAYAAFASSTTRPPGESWLQLALITIAAAACSAWLFGSSIQLQSSASGWIGVGLLCGFVAWTGITIAYSVAPDRSWIELNRALAYLLMLLCAMGVGSSIEDAPRRVAGAYGAVAIAVALYALGGKVFPWVRIDGLIDLDHAGFNTRLRAPLDYWNALSLFCVFAVPLFLRGAADPSRDWQARLRSTAAVFLLLVVQGLTYSRGGYLALTAALAVFFVFVPWRWRALAILGCIGMCALWTLSFAFARDDLTTNALPLDRRVDDGVLVLLVLLGLLAVALAAVRGLIELEQRRQWTPAQARRARRRGKITGLVFLGLVVVNIASGNVSFDEFTETRQDAVTDPSRLGSTNSGNRWVWWKEAVGAWSDEPLGGHGAGSFPVTHLQYRKDTLSVQQPHSVPLQFLAETGLIGFLLGVGAMLALLVAALARARGMQDDGARAWAGVALTVPVAYFVHWFYDWDWDFPAVTLAMLLFCGVLVARPARGPRAPRAAGDGRGLGLVAASVLLVGAALSAALPAVSESLTNRVVTDLPRRPSARDLRDAASRAELAAKLNPTAVEPLWAAATIAERRGSLDEAREQLLRALERQPESSGTWFRLTRIEQLRDNRAGLRRAAARVLELDPMNPISRALVARAYADSTPPNESPAATGTPLPRTVPAIPGTVPEPPAPGVPGLPGASPTPSPGASPTPGASPSPTPTATAPPGVPTPTPSRTPASSPSPTASPTPPSGAPPAGPPPG